MWEGAVCVCIQDCHPYATILTRALSNLTDYPLLGSVSPIIVILLAMSMNKYKKA